MFAEQNYLSLVTYIRSSPHPSFVQRVELPGVQPVQVPELDQAGQVHGVQVPRGQVLLHDLRAQGLQQHGGRGRGHQPLRGHLRHGRGLRRHHRQHRPRRRGVRQQAAGHFDIDREYYGFLYLYSIDTRIEKLWLTSISIIAQSVELFNAIKQTSASMKKTVIKFATAQSPRVTLVCSRVSIQAICI